MYSWIKVEWNAGCLITFWGRNNMKSVEQGGAEKLSCNDINILPQFRTRDRQEFLGQATYQGWPVTFHLSFHFILLASSAERERERAFPLTFLPVTLCRSLSRLSGSCKDSSVIIRYLDLFAHQRHAEPSI